MIYLVRAARRHCLETIQNIRGADRRELLAAVGSVEEAVLRGWLSSTFCYAGVDELGRTLGIFGVYRANYIWDVPWLIGTKALDEHNRELVRLSRTIFVRLRKRFPNMKNYVDVRNHKSVIWLKKLGFIFGAPVPYGVQRAPFYPFWIGGEEDV